MVDKIKQIKINRSPEAYVDYIFEKCTTINNDDNVIYVFDGVGVFQKFSLFLYISEEFGDYMVNKFNITHPEIKNLVKNKIPTKYVLFVNI
jgi:hypothetical protein